jgi:type II secretory pathway component PulK
MAIGTCHIAKTKDKAKVIKTRDALDVAARYFVYKLYEATDGEPMQWATLHGMDESRMTIARAVERGWVMLQPRSGA